MRLNKQRLMILLSITLGMMISKGAWSNQSWQQWLQGVRAQAVSEGISQATIREALGHLKPSKRVRHLQKNQPERRLDYLKYLHYLHN